MFFVPICCPLMDKERGRHWGSVIMRAWVMAELSEPAAAATVSCALALIRVTPALWSANYIVAHTALGVVEPHTLALGRWGLAGILLAFMARAELSREPTTPAN